MTMKRAVLVAAAGLLFGATAVAQPCGWGHGMMGDPGGGWGMGPGMMGGFGGGWGMGSGMMGGYGGGPGVGMGPGPMGGYGGGPGMMHGRGGGAGFGLDLTPEQVRQIAGIREETARVMWQLMGTLHQNRYHMHGMFGTGEFDEEAARQAYEMAAETHKAMFEKQIDARKRIDAVFTDEQREQLRKAWGGR